MNKKVTLNDIEILKNAVSKELPIEKYETSKKIVQKITKVKVLNEYEKSARQGFIEQVKFAKRYMNGRGPKSNGLGETFSDMEKNSRINPNSLGYTLFEILSSPFVFGYIVATSGIRLSKLLIIINQDKKLVAELKDAGIYDQVVEYVDSLAEDEAYEHDKEYLELRHTQFIKEELAGSKRR